MPEKAGLDFYTDDELVSEIKRQWEEKGLFDYELSLMDEVEAFSPANDYMGSDIEQHIADLETEARRRGLELPNRWDYVSEYFGDDDED